MSIGRDKWVLIGFGFVLLYMLVELLLDYVFKIEFREKLITHIPYIILEYIALFALIGISIDLNQTWGWVISISFWILMASLIYLYRGGKPKEIRKFASDDRDCALGYLLPILNNSFNPAVHQL